MRIEEPAMSQTEAEIKIPGPDVPTLTARLTDAGFTLAPLRARHFEDNRLFDTPDRTLSARGQALRLRETDGVTTMTYKGKPKDLAETAVKVREELELTIENADTMAAILDRLGFAPMFRYQKYRTVLEVTHAELGLTLHAMFDETPLGCFLELEGDESDLTVAMRRLNLGPGDYLTSSYPRLQAERCAAEGRPLSDMVFE